MANRQVAFVGTASFRKARLSATIVGFDYNGAVMNRVAAILCAAVATLLSALISIIGCLMFGAFLPMWAMRLIYGKQGVQDAPAHGGVILLATLPIAGAVAFCGFCVLTPVLYRRLSDHIKG